MCKNKALQAFWHCVTRGICARQQSHQFLQNMTFPWEMTSVYISSHPGSAFHSRGASGSKKRGIRVAATLQYELHSSKVTSQCTQLSINVPIALDNILTHPSFTSALKYVILIDLECFIKKKKSRALC